MEAQIPANPPETGRIAIIIYALYLAGFIVGITPLIGLVMAYVYREDAPDWVRTHYRFQIRTFWIGLLFAIVGGLLCMIFIGFFVLFLWFIWFLVRCIKGIKLASEGRAILNPETWLW